MPDTPFVGGFEVPDDDRPGGGWGDDDGLLLPGGDCLKAWFDWLATLDPVDAMIARAAGNPCFPAMSFTPVTSPVPWIPHPCIWEGGTGFWGLDPVECSGGALLPPCDLFSDGFPGDDSDCASGTWQELLSTCPPPCINPDDVPADSMIDDATTFLDLTANYDASDEEIALVECAWTMLRENSDLVEWLVCVVYGGDPNPDDLAGCLLATIQSPAGQNLRIELNDNMLWAGDDVWAAVTLTGKIRINMDSPEVQNAFLWWTDGLAVHQACACAWMAALLLHELVHVCGGELFDGLRNPECNHAKLIQTSFLWALSQRLTDMPCFGDDGLFFSTDPPGLDPNQLDKIPPALLMDVEVQLLV